VPPTPSQHDLATQPATEGTAPHEVLDPRAAAEPWPRTGTNRSGVLFDAGSGTWCLSMASSTYGFVIGDRGPRHLHWGAPVSLEALRSFPDPADLVYEGVAVARGEEDPLEYAAFGGRRFIEPALKVEFADGTRAVEWRVGGHRVDRAEGSETVVIELVDEHYPFAVELLYRIFDGEDVLERWARISNRDSNESVVLAQAYSAAWWLPFADRWRLRYLHGGWGRETQITEASLTPGKLVLESRRGTTSHQLNPWFALGVEGELSEERGEVWTGALAWSGSWKMVFETTPSGGHQVTGGWNEFDSPIVLEPGTSIDTPVFAGCYSASGYGGASRAWHAFQRRHIFSAEGRSSHSPSFPSRATRSPTAPRLRPVLYNSWEATGFAVNERDQLRLAELAADIGIELFVLDDGWFKGRVDDRAGLGDWSVDEAKFPLGLGPLIDGVHRLGMGFGLWLEPEMVNPDSDLYRAHPEWVYHFATRSRTEARNQLVLNLARPDVAEWVYGTVDRLLSENDIQFIKWDMNRHFSEPGWPAMAGNNPERVWIDHVRNLYDILERLRAAHPEVALEACSSGGGRIDLGIFSRVEQVWTSDNTDAWDRIAIQEGFTQIYSPLSMATWVTDSPNPLTQRRLSLEYRFHIAMAGVLAVGGDLTQWSPDELAQARELVALYKSVRHVVQGGRLYRLASTRQGPIGGVLYLDDEGREAVVIAYWGVRSYGPHSSRLRLTGLDDRACYCDAATGTTYFGSELMQSGIELAGPLDFGSVFVHLVRLPA
jgi:alpha-galactosidase